MNLKCGIVGLPNVGKSTLFKALTKVNVPIENYAFCTIDPHKAVVRVPDPRLEKISQIIQPQKVTPTTMEFVDIAGLVKGAHKGEGLGNQFLSHVREAHALIHVLRCFEDPEITHVSNKIDPVEDMEMIQTELNLADLQSVENFLKKRKNPLKKKDPIEEPGKDLLEALANHLSHGNPANSFFNLTKKEDFKNFKKIQTLHLLTLKPMLYLCNLNEKSALLKKNEIKTNKNETLNSYVKKVKEHLKGTQNKILSLCASLEAEMSELSLEDQNEFLRELNLKEPGLDQLIRKSYDLLGLETFFTAGSKEVRAWTIKKGTSAPKAAGLIHTDFEKGFIRAQVFHCKDLFLHKEEKHIKAKGLYRLEGKDYIVKDGDIIFFKFNV